MEEIIIEILTDFQYGPFELWHLNKYRTHKTRKFYALHKGKCKYVQFDQLLFRFWKIRYTTKPHLESVNYWQEGIYS